MININGLGESLRAYHSKSHSGKSVETIAADLKKIFDEFDVDNSNYNLLKVAFSNSSISLNAENKEAFIKSMAKKLFDREIEKEKTEKEKNQPKDKQYLVQKLKRIMPIDIYDFEVRGKNPEEIKQAMINKFANFGFSAEDLNRPMSDFIENSGTTLPNTFLETFTHAAIALSNKSKTWNSAGKNFDKTLENPNEVSEETAKTENSQKNPVVNGFEITPKMQREMIKYKIKNPEDYAAAIEEVKKMGLYQEEPDTPEEALEDEELDDDGLDTTNSQPQDLTDEVKELIDAWGVEGINNMNDWKAFTESEEFEMIQQMQSRVLSKDNNTQN